MNDRMTDKVRVGVVGTNFITDWMIAGARLDHRFELAAVCSRRLETGMAFAGKHSIGRVFTSVEEMAASDAVDAVYIATPNFMHASQAVECMRHGKHVLCEKPMAADAGQVKAMIEASRRYGVTLLEAMKPTLTPRFRVVMENMPRIGVVRRYFASYCQYSSRYDSLKSGALPNAFNPAMANGAVMDIGVYAIYPMVVLFGKPRQVIASGTLMRTGADGQGSVICRYDGFDAVVMYSKISDSMLPSEIQGESGTLTLDRINQINCVTFTPHVANNAGGSNRSFVAERLTDGLPGVANDYYYEMKEFIDLIQSGRRESSVNSHAASLATIEVVDQIRSQLGVHFDTSQG